jgi:hypothetical protein
VFAVTPEGNIVSRVKRSSAGGLYIEFPGGGIDKGEGPKTAAKREAMEECGITLKNIEFVSRVKWRWPKKMQEAMGSWSNLYAGEDNHIFIAEVDTVGSPTSEEGDGWDKLHTKTFDQVEKFLNSHLTGGLGPMNGTRLNVLKKLRAKTPSQSALNKNASDINVNVNYEHKRSDIMNKAAFLLGYNYKPGMDKEARRKISKSYASFMQTLCPTLDVYGDGQKQPIDTNIPHNWGREHFKLDPTTMSTGGDTGVKNYS